MKTITQKISFLLLICFVLICFSFASSRAQKQDTGFIQEQMKYAEALQFFNQELYVECNTLLESLLKLHSNTFEIHYLSAKTNYHLNSFNESKSSFENTLQLNPYLAEEPEFLLYYGLTLKKLGNISEAYEVLVKCIEHDKSEEQVYSSVATTHISELEKAEGYNG